MQPAEQFTFHTPSGRYFAIAADAAFWTKVEQEREAREGARRPELSSELNTRRQS